MNNKINQIKNLVKDESFNLCFIDMWFYSFHLLGVERFAKEHLKSEAEGVIVEVQKQTAEMIFA